MLRWHSGFTTRLKDKKISGIYFAYPVILFTYLSVKLTFYVPFIVGKEVLSF
jgi:hypothetical protein